MTGIPQNILELAEQDARSQDENIHYLRQVFARQILADGQTISTIRIRIAELEAKVKRMEDALNPFAERGKKLPRHWNGAVPFKAQAVPGFTINPALVSDYWRAADALSALGRRE